MRKSFVQIDGVRYVKYPFDINYSENKYLDHYRDVKMFSIKNPIENHY